MATENSHYITVKDIKPTVGPGCFFAPGSFLVGQVTAGADCSFWFHALVRGDVNTVTLGDRVNVQDGAIIHCTYKTHPTQIGNDVSIGHGAIVHGCTLHDRVLVGMGAIVMDGAVVEQGAVIAAGAVVKEGAHVGPGELYAGVPARRVKEMGPESAERLQAIAQRYVMYKGWYSEG